MAAPTKCSSFLKRTGRKTSPGNGWALAAAGARPQKLPLNGQPARLREVIPVGRMGQPDEIAALVSYLAGPEAGYVTGASLTIDGGYVL